MTKNITLQVLNHQHFQEIVDQFNKYFSKCPSISDVLRHVLAPMKLSGLKSLCGGNMEAIICF